MTMGSETRSPNADEVCAALVRLRAAPAFARSPRLASFIDYIVSETLAGRSAELRAYTVATAVFDRAADFDPHSNSIVRVEATRLRKALKTYYEGLGADDPVVVSIPLGGYVPTFAFRHGAPNEQSVAVALAPNVTATSPAEAPQKGLATRRALAGVSLAAAIALAAGVGSRVIDAGTAGPDRVADLRGGGSNPALPVVAVQRVQVLGQDIEAYAMAGELQRDLADAISRFDEVGVQRGFARSAANGAPAADYELHGHLDSLAQGAHEATFRLLHAGDHRIVWSGAFNFASFNLDAHGRSSLVRSIVIPIAQPFGVVVSDLRSRVEAGFAVPKSAECIARFEDFWESRAEAKRRTAFDCVTGGILAHPNTVLFQVLLSNLYVAEYLGDLPKLGGRSALDAAEEAATRAIRMAPGRAHPYLALSQVLNLRHDYDKALRLAERAMQINPLDTDIMAQLGALYVLRGRLAEGGQLLHNALQNNPAYPAWIRFYLFLEAWLREDKSAQAAALRGAGATEESDVAFARVVAAADAGNLTEAKQALALLRAQYPGFAAAPKAALERLTLAPEIADRMVQTAQRAGL